MFSSIDHGGRYAYGNQPAAMLWNLARLAETLLPVLEQVEGNGEAALAWANEALSAFPAAIRGGSRRGLGPQARTLHRARRATPHWAGPARSHGREPR